MLRLHFLVHTSRSWGRNNICHVLGIDDDTVNEDIVRTIGTDSPFRLEDFDYNNHKVLEIIFGHLHRTSFDGLTVKHNKLPHL